MESIKKAQAATPWRKQAVYPTKRAEKIAKYLYNLSDTTHPPRPECDEM
jgi:hypothetical protein